MWVAQGHYCSPTCIRRTEDPNTSIVVRNVFQQPIDGVISIGAVIGSLRILTPARGLIHDKLPFRPKTATYILKHENVSVDHQLVISLRFDDPLVRIWDSIRAAGKKERQGLVLIFRNHDYGLQTCTVAHRYHHFIQMELFTFCDSCSGYCLSNAPHRPEREHEYQRQTRKKSVVLGFHLGQ